MKKRLFTVLSLLSLILSILISCSSDADNLSKGKQEPLQELRIGKIVQGQYVEASPDINKDKYMEKLREMSGINVYIDPLIPHLDHAEKTNLLFAGGDLPDLLQTYGINIPEVAPAVDRDVLLPLNDLIDEHGTNLKENIPEEAWNSPKVSKDGKIYGIPEIVSIRTNNVVFVRKDWLDNLGLERPSTVDEYIDMLRAFKSNDPNGNGENDEIPFSGRENFAFSDIFFGAYDVLPGGWKYVNEQLIPNFIRLEMKDALEVYRLLYKEELLDNEFMVQDGRDWDAKIKGAGIVGMWQHQATSADKWLLEVRENTPSAEVEILPAPLGPDGKGGAGSGSLVLRVYVIPESNKNPEVAVKFLDWFHSGEPDVFLTYGIEGENYTVNNGEIEYSYPETQAEIYEEEMYHGFLDFKAAGQTYLLNEEFRDGMTHGDLLSNALDVAQNEGRLSDGLDMPAMPTLQARPELDYTGLWMEFAAKVITGEETVDNFDNFVEDWKKRGGDNLIKEATDWYNETYRN